VTDSANPPPRYPVRLVALRTGLTPHVLRAWERRYGVVVPSRSEGGQRLYSERDVERLRLLRRLTERGHAISRLAALPLDELNRLDAALPSREAEAVAGRPARGGPYGAVEVSREAAGEFAAGALRATRRLDAAELQALLERAAVTLGVPAFLDAVVAPALEEIGHGWTERSVTVAQEHMATDVFRRVLGWLLRVYEAHGTAPRLTVATPPGQRHELGALMVAASAAAEGWAVTYLGPDLPVADLLSAAAQTGARAVGLSVVYPSDEVRLRAIVQETRAGLPEGVPLVIGGAAAAEVLPEAGAAGVLVMDSLSEFRALLQRLAPGEAA